MAFYLNQFHCIGNLVADPELKDAGASKVCKFRIAINNPHNESAYFFYVDVWGKEGEKCMLLKKGAQVFISNASIIPKQYTKNCNGQEVTCSNFTVNVDGYCGKIQFGPKFDQDKNNSAEEKPKRGRPKKQGGNTSDIPKKTPIEKISKVEPTQEETYDDFEENFEF